MRSIVVALLTALPVVCESHIHRSLMDVRPPGNKIAVERRGERQLQGNITSFYSAVWYFVHEGSCMGAAEPSIILKCAGGDGISVESQSQAVACGDTTGTDLSVECFTEAVVSSGHAVDFSCSGASLDETLAEATIPTQVDPCLGGDQLAAEWGHGLLLSLVCDGARALNGTCTPLNTTFPDSTCTSGWSCPIGNCTEGNYTIEAMTSSITINDCSEFEVPDEPGAAPMTSGSVIHATIFSGLITAAIAMLIGGW